MNEKILTGQFFTKKDYWLEKKHQIIEFIHQNFNDNSTVIDPFYGEGDLIKTFQKIIKPNGFNILGFDIDLDKINNENVFWNDSLINIENSYVKNIKNPFFLTNPPYLAKVSAKRKKINEKADKYYSEYLDDLYKVALNKMVISKIPGVAIVPESFINSSFFNRIHSSIDIITTIIPNPFEDTSTPICVVCFNGKKTSNNTQFYINDMFVYDYLKFRSFKLKVKTFNNQYKIIFNSKMGQIGLRAVDSTIGKDIGFVNSKNFNYPVANIKISSRMMTYLYVDEKLLDKIGLDNIIDESNKILQKWRKETEDLVFTPFKGNIDSMTRRRRVDYRTARWIITKAITNLGGNDESFSRKNF